MPTEIVVALWGFAVAWLIANLAVLVHNRLLFCRRGDFTSGGSLLVVVAHQDDEIIVAGGAMLKTLAKGGEVHVIFTVDGVTRDPSLTHDAVRRRIESRERESLNALADLGIPERNAHFLRYENEQGLRQPANAVEAIDKVSRLIRELDPYAIVTCTFEGSHCDHDLTNFIVARAVEEAGFPREKVFEAPEYNRFYLREYLERKMNHFLLVRFRMPPRFLPGADPGRALAMSREELSRKRSLFRHFKTQEPERLATRFDFPDQFRALCSYDYAKGPFKPSASLRYRLGSWLKKKDRGPFSGSMTADDYQRIYTSLEEAWRTRRSHLSSEFRLQ